MTLNTSTSCVYQALGLRENEPLPDGPYPPVLAPITDYQGRYKYYWYVRLAAKGTKTQRVEAQCPACARWFSAGNLNQHLNGFRTRRGKVEGCHRPAL